MKKMNKEITEKLINNIKSEIKQCKKDNKDFALCIEQWEQILDYIEQLQHQPNTIHDNGEIILGGVKEIIEYTKKQFEKGLVDEEFKTDILNDLKDYNDTDIVAINYDHGMGYSIDCWEVGDIIKE